MDANLVIYDVGSTFTKVSAFREEQGRLQFLARDQVPTTLDDIEIGLAMAHENLERHGLSLAEGGRILSASSAAGGLRMVGMGYMPRVTAKAAKEVAMSAGARVLEIVTHEDPPEYRREILREIQPDIILLAGGTDGGDRQSILENARIIAEVGSHAVVIIAGNQAAQADVAGILTAKQIKWQRVQNVMPTIHELKVGAAREVIHEQFIRQISQAKGLHALIQKVSNNKVLPTPGAVLLAAELLARGTHAQRGIGDVMIVDIGGATTDIHSILPTLDKISIEEKGLVVTNEKQAVYRTVEGNLGLRVSATGILETLGADNLLARAALQGPELKTRLVEYCHFLEEHPEHITQDVTEKKFDLAMAMGAIEVALKRHAGHIAQEVDPVMGIVPGVPIGRDLRQVETLIAVGGIFTHSSPEDRRLILDQALKNPGISLLPKKPRVYFDSDYLLYAVGVLSQVDPDMALGFAKQYFQIEDKDETNDKIAHLI